MSDKSVADMINEYLALGGTRKSSNDDNITSTRKWNFEPAEAKSYWETNIATLEQDRLSEAETLLPSVSTSG